MAPAATPRRIVRFGVYELNRDTGELRKGGLKIKLQDQPFQVLAMLVERPGELITREELLNRLWPSGTFVDFDHGLNVAVKKLRQALGDTAENPRFVETLSRRGYRFVAPVENVPTDSEDGSEGLPPGTIASVEPAHRSARSLLPWVLVGFSVVAAASALWYWWPANPARPVITRFTISLPPSDQFSMPRGGLAISPDGRYLAYSASATKTGAQQLYLRPMDRNEAALIPGTEGAMGPFFSPDGEWIAFTAGGQLKKVPVHGGTPITLCAKINPSTGSWGSDGIIVFTNTQHAVGNENGKLMRVTAAGRDLQVVTPPETTPTEFPPRWPHVLPAGDAILYVIGGTSAAFSDDATIVAQSLRSGERKILIHGGTSPRYVSTGYLIYAQGGRLLAARFDAARLEVTGTAFPVAEDIWQGPAGYVAYDVSPNGALVSLSAGDRGVGNRTMSWADSAGTFLPINAAARQYSQPSLSPDGKHIAVAIGDPLRQCDIWILDFEQNSARQFTHSQAGESATAPLWTRDGRRIIYAGGIHGRSLYWKDAGSNGPAELLFNGDLIDPSAPGMILATSLSPDGGSLIFERGDLRHFDLWVMSLSGEHKPSHLFEESDITRTFPQISPDGRRLAYISDESGREEVYVQPLHALNRKWRVSVEGGEEPRWSTDGHHLFFRHGNKMMAVNVQAKSMSKEEHAYVLFEGPYARSDYWTNYDVSSDGQHFVMLKEEDEARQNQMLRVVLNWGEELEAYSRRASN